MKLAHYSFNFLAISGVHTAVETAWAGASAMLPGLWGIQTLPGLRADGLTSEGQGRATAGALTAFDATRTRGGNALILSPALPKQRYITRALFDEQLWAY